MMADDLFIQQVQPAKSLEAILLLQTKVFIANSSTSQSSFVHELLLPKLIKAGLEQQGQYHTAEEYEKWHSNKVRQINNVLNEKTNVPARWVNVWLSVLPPPYGIEARKEILNLMGALDLPDLSGLNVSNSNKADLASLFVEVADVMREGAQVCADGSYDEKDDPKELVKLSNELVDVIEHSAGQLALINKTVDLSKERAGLVLRSITQINN